MLKKKIKILIIPIVFSLVFLANPVMAWNASTHKFLWQEAIRQTGIDLKKDCDKNQIKKILNTAPVQPDREGRKDRHNCFEDYCPAREEMAKLIEKAKKETNFCTKMFLFGKASHYLTDALNPVHQKEAISNSCHKNFESKVWQWIKSGFQGDVQVKCGRGRGTQIFKFNKGNFDELINRIKTEILGTF